MPESGLFVHKIGVLTGKWDKAPRPNQPRTSWCCEPGLLPRHLEDALVGLVVQALDNADVVATQNMFDDANASDVVDLLEAHK